MTTTTTTTRRGDRRMSTLYVRVDFARAVEAASREGAKAQARAIIAERVHPPGLMLDVSPIRAEASAEADDV